MPSMKSILTPLSFLLLTQATAQTIQYSDLSPYGVQADMQYLNADDLPALADADDGRAVPVGLVAGRRR